MQKGYRMKLDGTGLRGSVRGPRIRTWSKTNKPFIIIKNMPKDRAIHEQLWPEIGFVGIGYSNCHRLSAEFRLLSCFQFGGLCLVFFLSRPQNAPPNQPRQFRSQFNMLSQLPLDIGGNIGLE